MSAEPVDDELIQLLLSRDGVRTDVKLKDGRIFAVFNIAWGYDVDDPYAHISTNVSPGVEGQPFDFFFSHEIAAVIDPADGSVLCEPSW